MLPLTERDWLWTVDTALDDSLAASQPVTPCVGDCYAEKRTVGVSFESLEGNRASVGRLLVVVIVLKPPKTQQTDINER